MTVHINVLSFRNNCEQYFTKTTTRANVYM